VPCRAGTARLATYRGGCDWGFIGRMLGLRGSRPMAGMWSLGTRGRIPPPAAMGA
jgi:hypothetical protein